MLIRRSTSSSDIAIVTAASFAIIAAIVGGLADGAWHRSTPNDWRLRGTLPPSDARLTAPTSARAFASRDTPIGLPPAALRAGAKAV